MLRKIMKESKLPQTSDSKNVEQKIDLISEAIVRASRNF